MIGNKLTPERKPRAVTQHKTHYNHHNHYPNQYDIVKSHSFYDITPRSIHHGIKKQILDKSPQSFPPQKPLKQETSHISSLQYSSPASKTFLAVSQAQCCDGFYNGVKTYHSMSVGEAFYTSGLSVQDVLKKSEKDENEFMENKQYLMVSKIFYLLLKNIYFYNINYKKSFET